MLIVRDISTLEAWSLIRENPDLIIEIGDTEIRAGDIPGLHEPDIPEWAARLRQQKHGTS